MRRFGLLFSLVLLLFSALPKQRPFSGTPGSILLPISAGYDEVFPDLLVSLFDKLSKENLNILLLAGSLDVNSTLPDEQHFTDLQDEIQAACSSCKIDLLPLLHRTESEKTSVVEYFEPKPDAMILLGINPSIFVKMILGTLLEDQILTAYKDGSILVSVGESINIQTQAILAGSNPSLALENSLDFDYVNVWNSPEKHGLNLGLQDVIFDNNIFLENRVGRLINAVAHPGTPDIGVGIDAYSGFYLLDGELIQDVIGSYSILILDAHTYHAAESVIYADEMNTLSLRNILVHLLAPGDYEYNLSTRQHNLAAAASQIERNFEELKLPAGAGPLMILGDLASLESQGELLNRFINLSGGKNANILVVAAGFPTERAAREVVEIYDTKLAVNASSAIISQGSSEPFVAPPDVTGIILIGQDQSLFQPESIKSIKSSWLSGVPLLASGAAASLVGSFYSAHPPTPEDEYAREAATQASFIVGGTEVLPGLALINITVEPYLIQDNRWGRFFSLAYLYPEQLALGLDANSGLLLTEDSTRVVGKGVVLALDFRNAVLDQSENSNYVIANGLLDVFAFGDLVVPKKADMAEAPLPMSTPVLPTSTHTVTPTNAPTLTATASPTPRPPATTPVIKPATKTLRPTATPPEIPPPTDPNLITAIIVVGVFAVFIVFIGIWINRRNIP